MNMYRYRRLVASTPYVAWRGDTLLALLSQVSHGLTCFNYVQTYNATYLQAYVQALYVMCLIDQEYADLNEI